ncbi:endonuclease-reverse transcriptase [Trichonephila clavipes]|nr:endonuclease-reverse transcriptase [Trichonephila clavipes]
MWIALKLDYFLWGCVKSLVFSDKPQTLHHLEDNIRRVIADVRPQMLEKVIENWTSRLDYIRASRGNPMPEIIFKILRWLGHIWRSPENNQTRACTFKNPMGSRRRGIPPTSWIDDAENDLKTLNIKNWQRVAAYRWNWKKRAVEAAKTCNRLLRL